MNTKVRTVTLFSEILGQNFCEQRFVENLFRGLGKKEFRFVFPFSFKQNVKSSVQQLTGNKTI